MTFEDDFLQKKSDEKTKAVEKIIASEYKKSLKEVQGVLGDLHEKYAVNGVLSMSELTRFNRYKQFEEQLVQVVSKLTKGTYEVMADGLVDQYITTHLSTSYLTESQLEMDLNIVSINSKGVKDLLLNGANGVSLESIAVQHQAAFVYGIKQELVASFIVGESYQKTAARLTGRFNMETKRALKIARTENARVSTNATLDSLRQSKELGLDVKKKWLSAHDARTRKSHQKLDGQIRDIDEPFNSGRYKTMGAGLFHVAAEDINCRCTTIPVYSTEGLDRIKNTAASYKKVAYRDWLTSRLEN